MVLSFSRPDPSSPSAVAGASFSPARRGFDQTEVRDFLRMVSAEMARLQERVVFLEREVREAKQAKPLVSADMNEAMIAELLGEETARIIEAAREAARKIRERSEDAAGRIIKEASEEATRIREETELECARRRQDATSDAEAEILMAKQQGREMVNEARSYRERVLADVARRRELAREQLQDLYHGRERLVHAFERARATTDDVLRDLIQPADEPTAFVNLAPTTGPVPVIVQADDIERLEAIRPPSSAPDFPSDEQIIDEQESEDNAVQLSDDSETDEETRQSVGHIVTEISLEEVSVDEDDEIEHEPVSNVVPLFSRAESRAVEARRSKPVVDDTPAEQSDKARRESRPKIDAGDIFERLRRASTETVAADASRHVPKSERIEEVREEPKPVVVPVSTGVDDSACFASRNEALIPIIVAMSRMVKRVLADEQNQVLDILRGKPVIRNLEALVGSRTEHGGRYVASLNNLLNEAAIAGARSLSAEPEKDLMTAIEAQRSAIHEFVVFTLIDPLRGRLERSIAQSSDSNAELAGLVRLVYREWKNQFVDEHMDDVALTAYGRGAAAVLDPSMKVCWKVDPDGPPCADAEDNSLGGFVAGGEEFPTGHTHAPAHAGCRCVLVPDQN
ncbi:MAG: DivIVA domain-containing protein [Actinomycetota bacterium]